MFLLTLQTGPCHLGPALCAAGHWDRSGELQFLCSPELLSFFFTQLYLLNL
jgi:hypothetical protein